MLPDTTGANGGSDDKASTQVPTVAADRDTGAALRSVYQRTVEEAIPDEMMDLLGKLT